eukprot:3481839-Prymnesium_polylepis.2
MQATVWRSVQTAMCRLCQYVHNLIKLLLHALLLPHHLGHLIVDLTNPPRRVTCLHLVLDPGDVLLYGVQPARPIVVFRIVLSAHEDVTPYREELWVVALGVTHYLLHFEQQLRALQQRATGEFLLGALVGVANHGDENIEKHDVHGQRKVVEEEEHENAIASG